MGDKFCNFTSQNNSITPHNKNFDAMRDTDSRTGPKDMHTSIANIHAEKIIDNIIKLNKKYNINCVECGKENIGVRSTIRCKIGYYEYYLCNEHCKNELFAYQSDVTEFLTCSYCNKNINKGLTILCDICKSRCHKKCIQNLNNKEFKILSQSVSYTHLTLPTKA